MSLQQSMVLRNKGFVFSGEQLLEILWGYDYAGDTQTVDVHIRWLRQKIEIDSAQPRKALNTGRQEREHRQARV